LRDYYLVTVYRYGTPSVWGWEIRRRSSPLGVKFHDEGFKSATTAKAAGKAALHDFLAQLYREKAAETSKFGTKKLRVTWTRRTIIP
jgi:hypothetical protein